MRIRLWVLVAGLTCGVAQADEDDAPRPADPFYRLDSKNLFGALEGSDVGEPGDRSVELETTAALFKRAGRYAFVEQEEIYEFTPAPRLGVEFGAHAYGQSIRQPQDGYSGFDFAGVSNEWRYVLVPRGGAWNVQATASVTAQGARLFEGGGRGIDLTVPLLLILEAQPVARRLYAVVNLAYAPEWARAGAAPWARASAWQASAGLSLRLTPDAMIGAEADALSLYDSLDLRGSRGSAYFLGPTFHYQITEKVDLSGAWTQQIAGAPRAPKPEAFTRSQAKLRLEMDF